MKHFMQYEFVFPREYKKRLQGINMNIDDSIDDINDIVIEEIVMETLKDATSLINNKSTRSIYVRQ